MNKVVCKCKIPKSADTGYWDVVIVRGWDDTEIVKTNTFVVADSVSISSISPDTARAGEEDIDFKVTGSGFDTDMDYEVYLVLDGELDDIIVTAYSVKTDSSTKISGTFDIDDDVDEEKYDLCIEDEYNVVECDNNAFEVTTNKEGTLEISSSPSGASILIDDIANGTTPRDIDLLVGSYKIVLKKSGYQDWGKIVNVYEDDTTEVDAKLVAAATATPTTTARTTVATTRPTTVRTTIKTTIQIPTTFAEATTTAKESPVEPAVVAGALCVAVLALRRLG